MPRLSHSARREEIITAALRVASAKGLGNTTVRDVAAEMGTSSGLIHHYFSSMDDVLAAAFEAAAGADLAATEKAMGFRDNAGERLSTFFATYTRSDYRAFQMWLDAWAEATRRPVIGATTQRLNVAWQRLVAATIIEGVDEGAMVCDDPGATAWRVLSLLDGLSLQVFAHPGVIAPGVVVEWAMTAFEAEVGLPTGSLKRPVATQPSTSTPAT